MAAVAVILVASIAYELYRGSFPSLSTFGLGFIVGRVWDPAITQQFGAAPVIWGTLVTSAIALLLAVPISLGIGLLLSEFAPHNARFPLALLVELLAAVPSVIYGLWGIFTLAPTLSNYFYPALQSLLGFLPIFSGPYSGQGVLTGGIVLAIMITPTISAVSREVFNAVPRSQREAFYALGATRWETAKHVLSYGRSGVVGAIMLGLGRAIGETMAITMVIGNRFGIPQSLLGPGYTMAAIIANEFNEAIDQLYVSALIEIGLLLFVMTLIIGILARLLIRRSMRLYKGVSVE